MCYLYYIARFLVLILPRRCSYFIARVISSIKFYISKKDRDAVVYNLKPVVKDDKRAIKYAKKVFNNFSFYLVDFLNMGKINKDFISKYVRISGIDNIERLVKLDKGIVLLSAHIGNHEFGAAIVKLLGYNLHAIALPHKDKCVNSFFNHQRSIFDIDVIPTGRAIVKCIKLLRDKGMIALVGDRDFTSAKGERNTMFGRDTLLPKGPAFFALKTDSFILPSFSIREEKYYYHFVFEPCISPRRSDGVLKKESDLVKEYSRVLEKYVAKYSDQWYMFQKYWL